MDARKLCVVVALLALASLGADFATPHFVVKSPDAQLARRVGEEAERFRRELALDWLGYELPAWKQKCFIFVQPNTRVGPQGKTNYDVLPTHIGGGVTNFRMEIEGPVDRLLDSVLPHEITHTVLASHFGHPVPRWADEGASTTVEHASETVRHEQLLRKYLTTRRGIPMNQLMLMQDYPAEILTLYAQGYSVARFLIEQRGRREFVTFLEDYFRLGSWTDSVHRHYGYASLAELQEHWVRWVADGNPSVANYVKAHPQLASLAIEPMTGTPPTDALVAGNYGLVSPSATSGARPLGPAALGPDASGWYARQRQEMAAREQLPPADPPTTPLPTAPLTTAPLPAGSLPSGPPAPASWGPAQGTLWR
jgi:hypothetical protein